MLFSAILNFISLMCIIYLFQKVGKIKENINRKLKAINKLNKKILDEVQQLHLEFEDQFLSLNSLINIQSKKIVEIETDIQKSFIELKKIKTFTYEKPAVTSGDYTVPNRPDQILMNSDNDEIKLATGGPINKESLVHIHSGESIIEFQGMTEKQYKEVNGVEDFSEGALPPSLIAKQHNDDVEIDFNPMQDQIIRNKSIQRK